MYWVRSRPTFKVVFIVVHTAPGVLLTYMYKGRGCNNSTGEPLAATELGSKFASYDYLWCMMALCKPATESGVTVLAKVPRLQAQQREILCAHILKQKGKQTQDGKN